MLLATPCAALAHSREAAGFVSGFLHPLLGLDHLLAMISVGVVSARIGHGYVWKIPAIFVCSMLAGGLLGAYGVSLPLVEWGIALSVLVLGLAIVLVHRAGTSMLATVMAFVALFGTLHGHAHGAEMPVSLSPAFYSSGFVVSTSAIHLLGVYIGMRPARLSRFARLPAIVGGCIAVAGVFILYGLIGDRG